MHERFESPEEKIDAGILRTQHIESKEEERSQSLEKLEEFVTQVQTAIESGDELTAAQWLEAMKASIRADTAEDLLSQENYEKYNQLYREFAGDLYGEEGVLEGSKRDFFEEKVGEVLHECDRFAAFDDIEDQATLRDLVHKLESLTAEYVIKSLSRETAEKLTVTLDVLKRRM